MGGWFILHTLLWGDIVLQATIKEYFFTGVALEDITPLLIEDICYYMPRESGKGKAIMGENRNPQQVDSLCHY